MATDEHTRFEALLQGHRGIVLKVANSYAWSAEDRADLAQEIAAQVWRSFPSYNPARPFSTWMYRIALNVAITHVRSHTHHQRHAVPLDDSVHDIADGNAADPEAAARQQFLLRLIAAQAPLDRALLLLYLEERSTREIADVLGISESNVTTKINRLKQRIRDQVALSESD
ncbi:sigma-70 family RNA polymerase sigma factor [Myxococcus sp. AM001]|uniref:RNA polymerase sigma factor n=1 Tax=Myxococcus vastator TaxID=2709664 RepID=UPI0013D11541|nr:sigma-70 family RNA polymerase sigma factor [Myxococcus vastator]NVJ04309.1 sigma-70 family RNA polymerase sigma factor [Myxococcus sp. AM001]